MAKKILNYYKILQVEKNADKETIEVICKHYLEKYGEEKYPKKHKIYHNAYEILTDDEKREKYDKLLESKKVENEEEKIETKMYNHKKSGKVRGKSGKVKTSGKSRRGRRYAQSGRGEMYGKSGKNNNISNAFNYVSDIENEYGAVSKIFKTLLGTAKSQPLLTGAGLLMGGAVAGKGIQKGRGLISKGKK